MTFIELKEVYWGIGQVSFWTLPFALQAMAVFLVRGAQHGLRVVPP